MMMRIWCFLHPGVSYTRGIRYFILKNVKIFKHFCKIFLFFQELLEVGLDLFECVFVQETNCKNNAIFFICRYINVVHPYGDLK